MNSLKRCGYSLSTFQLVLDPSRPSAQNKTQKQNQKKAFWDYIKGAQKQKQKCEVRHTLNIHILPENSWEKSSVIEATCSYSAYRGMQSTDK